MGLPMALGAEDQRSAVSEPVVCRLSEPELCRTGVFKNPPVR
jgi:hypothetical protein